MNFHLANVQKLTIVMATAFTLSACSSVTHSSEDESAENLQEKNVAVAEESRENLMDEMLGLVGDANADTLSQCKILAVGQRPCGGPEGYIAYSTLDTNVSALIRLTSRYNRLSVTRVEEEGMYSTCEIVPEPPVHLSNGKCVLGSEATH